MLTVVKLLELHEQLKSLPYPVPGGQAYFEVKKKLLDPKLKRSVQTKELYEPATNTRRRVRFNTNILVINPWLMMGDRRGYCIYCKLFGSTSVIKNPGDLVVRPFLTYSRSKACEVHNASGYHSQTTKLAIKFMSISEGREPGIVQQVQRGRTDHHVRAKRLQAVAKNIVSLAKQGLPLRGHRNEVEVREKFTKMVDGDVIVKGDVNRGNFIHFLQVRGDAGDQDVSHTLNERARYTSSIIQNELLDVMGNKCSRI